MTTQSTARQIVFPNIGFADAPALIEWLEHVFGFETTFRADGDDGVVHHAELSFNGGIVMVSTAQGIPAEKPDPMHNGMFIHVDDVDAHYDRAVEAGAHIVRAIHNSDHGSRDYSAVDPEGNGWHFGTYLPEWHPVDDPGLWLYCLPLFRPFEGSKVT